VHYHLLLHKVASGQKPFVLSVGIWNICVRCVNLLNIWDCFFCLGPIS